MATTKSLFVFALLALGCKDPSAAGRTESAGGQPADVTAANSGAPAVGGDGGRGRSGGAPHYVTQFASSMAQSLNVIAGSGGTGSGGTASQPPGPPFGTSTMCGDAIVGGDEECDDGAGTGLDACTAACQTHDQAAVAGQQAPALGHVQERYLGEGRHPISGLDSGFINTYVEVGDGEPTIGATLFNIWGQPAHHVNVSDSASPIDDANPVAAALPSGAYAVAWSDFDVDGSDLGVALRKVNSDGTQSAVGVANARTEFSQLNPDMLWTGSQLVVAWEDYADAVHGPDLRYRLFDADLNSMSDDLVLGAGASPEGAVALASFEGSWAAAYREGNVDMAGNPDGQENIVVKVAGQTFRLAPAYAGPPDDRPALVELDATHLLVAFSAGTDPDQTGVYNLPRVRYAIIDLAGSTTPTSVPLDPLDDVYSSDIRVAQMSPSAERGAGGAYLAWRSEARAGDAAGDQLWLKYMTWAPRPAGGALMLEARDAELLIPRTCDASIGDQRRPELARVALPPNNALAIAWDDYSRSQGPNSGEPDVVVHYAPLPAAPNPTAPQVLTETWTAPHGAAWPSRWTSQVGTSSFVDVRNKKGEFRNSTGIGWAEAYVNDHTALNIDMVTTVWMLQNVTRAGVFARRSADDDDSYLGAQVSTTSNDYWRIYSMIDGVSTDLDFLPIPKWFNRGGISNEFQLRFRVTTASNGSVFVGMKYWHTGSTEPSTWLLQSTQLAGSAVATRFGSLAGRFGLKAGLNTTNRRVNYDDFRAVFFEGNQLGDLDIAPNVTVPLRRSLATYRNCRPGQTCAAGQGCCFGNTDCSSGLACTASQSEYQGVGSHGKACAPSHCANLKLDGGETRVDCGGPDCAPCSCTSTAAPGSGQYCTDSCLCGIGDMHCENGECVDGLACGFENSLLFGGVAGNNACAPPHCFDRVLETGETATDCGGDCGSCTCDPVNGAHLHCRVYCPCPAGQGDCTLDDECQTGLICSSKGSQFGLAAGSYACAKAHCENNVFEPALGETKKDCGGECGTVCP